jgi:hypothetical protein
MLLLVLQEKLHWIFQLYGFKRNRGVIVCGQQYMLWVLVWMSCLISYQQLTGSNQILLLWCKDRPCQSVIPQQSLMDIIFLEALTISY